jgi:hypothetical protein
MAAHIKKNTENMTAKFDVDETSTSIIANEANYGGAKCWVLLPDAVPEVIVVSYDL